MTAERQKRQVGVKPFVILVRMFTKECIQQMYANTNPSLWCLNDSICTVISNN